jgi:hypothetical protein
MHLGSGRCAEYCRYQRVDFIGGAARGTADEHGRTKLLLKYGIYTARVNRGKGVRG